MQKHGVPLGEAARRLGISQSSLFTALQQGQIPTLRRNGQTLVSPGALKEYQARKRRVSDYRL